MKRKRVQLLILKIIDISASTEDNGNQSRNDNNNDNNTIFAATNKNTL